MAVIWRKCHWKRRPAAFEDLSFSASTAPFQKVGDLLEMEKPVN
jgi:hypothetical protein